MAEIPPVVSPPDVDPLPLARLAYPPYVLVLAAITAVAFVLAVVRAPRTIGYGVEAERGRRALREGRFTEADRRLAKVVQAFPESKETRMDYAEACIKANDSEGANSALSWFNGKEVSSEQNARLDEIQEEGNQRFATAPDSTGATRKANP